MRLLPVTAFRLMLCLLLGAQAWAQADERAEVRVDVRVLLAELPGETEVVMPGAHRGFLDGELAFETDFALAWPFEARGDLLYMDGLAIGRVLRLEGLEAATFTWQGGRYRGAVELGAEDGVLRVINVVDLEDYLRGVVPAEMIAGWPIEALKAQAVAARSYVLAARDRELDYDVCATVLCQVYRGASAETPATDWAVEATRGLVLSYGDGLAKTYYHSHSGGYLASSLEVWGYTLAYLPGHADAASPPPHHAWDFRLEPAAIERSLAALSVAVGPVRRLEVLERSASGRVARARVVGDRASVTLAGTELTKLLRSWGLKSTRFTMHSDLVARGGGYGHGVGMSQYGAYSLASRGESFEAILRFYYPGTVLEPLTARLLEAPPRTHRDMAEDENRGR